MINRKRLRQQAFPFFHLAVLFQSQRMPNVGFSCETAKRILVHPNSHRSLVIHVCFPFPRSDHRRQGSARSMRYEKQKRINISNDIEKKMKIAIHILLYIFVPSQMHIIGTKK